MLCHEGMRYIIGRILPIGGAYASELSFYLGLSGHWPGGSERPNPTSAVDFDPTITLADVQDSDTEGGAYTDEMRTALGYSTQIATLTVAANAGGAEYDSGEHHWDNALAWARLGDWDDPATTTIIEQPPYPWNTPPWTGYPTFPWSIPRVKADWWETYDAGGNLNWLAANHMATSGFPITGCYLADDTYDVLVALSQFAAPVCWRPSQSIYLRMKGMIYGSSFGIFSGAALRMAQRAFSTGSSWSSFRALPLVGYEFDASHDYATVAAFAPSGWAAATVGSTWTWQAYSDPVEPYAYCSGSSWANSSGATRLVSHLLIAGYFGSDWEPLWVSSLDTSVPDGDTLVVDQIRFWLGGE